MNKKHQLPPSQFAHSNWKTILAVMFFGQMIASIGFSSVVPFLPLYVHSLGTSTAMSESMAATLVYSGHAFTMMVAAPLWGALADRHGRKVMVERAIFCGAILLVLMAFARTAEQLVLLRMLQGAVTGVFGAANALVAASTPREKTGYAMGLMQVAMGLGLAFGPVLGGFLADLFSYHSVFYSTAFLLALAGTFVYLFVDEHFVPRTPSSEKGEGLLLKWRRVLRTRGVSLLYLLRFTNQSGRIIFYPILPLFILTLIHDQGQINRYTGIVVGAASVSTALSSVFVGRFGNKVGFRPIVILCLFIAGVTFLLHCLAATGWQLVILQMVYGAALGGVITSISALLALFTEKGDEGCVYGLDSSVNSGAKVVGPLLCLAISSLFGLRMVFGIAGIFYLTGALLALTFLPKNE